MAIHLASMLPSRSSDLPGNLGGPPSIIPLFGLAPGGVYQAPIVTDGTGELLPHLFTLTAAGIRDTRCGGFLSVALSFPSPGLGVTQRSTLGSPDFPLLSLNGRAAAISTASTYALQPLNTTKHLAYSPIEGDSTRCFPPGHADIFHLPPNKSYAGNWGNSSGFRRESIH